MAVTGRRMGDVIVGLSILFLGLLIIARIETGHGVTLHGPFVAVDGDTLADRGLLLRLRGIDAPEIGQTCSGEDGQFDCGALARAALEQFLRADVFTCFGHEGDVDRYGRRLVTCQSRTQDLGREMVAAGLAVSDGAYHIAERQARQDRLGLWAGTFERPQDWRRRRMVETREQAGWFQTFLVEPLVGWFARGDLP